MKHSETGLCYLQGTCRVGAVLARLVGQVVTQKREEKQVASVQEDVSSQGEPHRCSGPETVPSGGLQWMTP